MPTYVYECEACEKVFEVEQRITEDPIKDCSCGSKGTVTRLIQPTAIMFKGSGFYVNDSTSATNSTTKSPETPTSEVSAAPANPTKSDE